MIRSPSSILATLLCVGCSAGFVSKDSLKLDDSGASVPTDTTPTETDTTEPEVHFLTPGEESFSPVTLSVETAGPIVRVAYYLESLPLVESTDAEDGFPATWRPEEYGQLTLTARGYSAEGDEIATDTVRTRVVDLAEENALGVWLLDNDASGYTHEELAQRLAALGVKRVYIQTAVGGSGCEVFPDACDKTVPAAYHERGLQAFAFGSPAAGGNPVTNNVTYVADADYDGYVLYLEDRWGSDGADLEGTVQAFRETVDENIRVGRAPSNFPLYVAAGPTPEQIDLRLDVVDALVDGFQPIVLVEQMGAEAIDAPEVTLGTVVCEYAGLGLSKPILPVIGTESGEVTPLGVNRFFEDGGAAASIWRVPDAGDPNDVWATWGKVDWTASTLPISAACNE